MSIMLIIRVKLFFFIFFFNLFSFFYLLFQHFNLFAINYFFSFILSSFWRAHIIENNILILNQWFLKVLIHFIETEFDAHISSKRCMLIFLSQFIIQKFAYFISNAIRLIERNNLNLLYSRCNVFFYSFHFFNC